MGFWYAYADSNGAKNAATETLLVPGPTRVEYPDPSQTLLQTPAGTTIVQRPLVDNRVRAWIWEGYPEWYVNYQALWAQIEPLMARYRLEAGDATPYVYLKEDETKQLRTVAVSGTTITPTYGWLRCRVTKVHRRMRTAGSSMVVYEETRLEFVIDDASYNDLG